MTTIDGKFIRKWNKLRSRLDARRKLNDEKIIEFHKKHKKRVIEK